MLWRLRRCSKEKSGRPALTSPRPRLNSYTHCANAVRVITLLAANAIYAGYLGSGLSLRFAKRQDGDLGESVGIGNSTNTIKAVENVKIQRGDGKDGGGCG